MSPFARLSATLAATRHNIASAADSTPLPIVAHKFGGSSLADAECFRQVADDSARARRRDPGHRGLGHAGCHQRADRAGPGGGGQGCRPGRRNGARLRERHLQTARDLLGERSGAMRVWLEARFADLADTLKALAVLGIPAREALDAIQGLGEVWSAHLLRAHIESLVDEPVPCSMPATCSSSATANSASRSTGRPARPAWPTGARAMRSGASSSPASSPAMATAGRPRSVATAAISPGRSSPPCSRRGELHIWTDVDGVLSADPRLVPEAVSLDALSYEEACELAYFGAKVIHPQTMLPAMALGLPIHIRNTFRPEHPGTRIASSGDAAQGPVRGLSLADQLAIVNVEGAGMIGVPGTAERVFAALRDARVSVVMISQGSSEHSICVVVRASDCARAEVALDAVFGRELASGQIQAITVTRDISVLAAVGDGMAGTPGVAARLFATLGRAQVNIRAIAQGASERNISVALASADASRALARRACRLLAVAADPFDRRDRSGQCRARPARTVARSDAAPARGSQPRPARARHRLEQRAC